MWQHVNVNESFHPGCFVDDVADVDVADVDVDVDVNVDVDVDVDVDAAVAP